MQTPDRHKVERERERLFYRYYDPIRALSDEDPPLVDLYNEDSAKRHGPKASPDHALTALCQLGALRLAARRAILLFFDREYAYVLTESTRTLSLLDDQVHQDAEDSLWLGNCRISRGVLVCESTMKLPTMSGDERDVLVINDLEKDREFCGRPFVTGGPQARFYAGVPLTTSNGVRIGVYCVMDDEPRDGLRDQDVDFLSEMSKAVMKHLEMVHARTEFGRQSRMIQGLSTFVKDATTSGPRPPRSRPSSVVMQTSSSSETQAATQTLVNEASVPAQTRPKEPGRKGPYAATDIQDDASDSESETADRRSVGQAQRRLDKQLDKDSGAGAQRLLHRAADVIRSAVDADGVVFLDASSQFGDGHPGLADETASTTDATGSDDSIQRSQAKDCRTLGQSSRELSHKDASRVPMREKVLKTLLRRHPQGKVWTFNSDGEVSSTEEGTSDDRTEPQLNSHRRRTYRKSGAKSDEAQRIQECFPNARAVCLVPMWDPVRERWFAGAFMWTYSPSRVFSLEGETAYLMAFTDVVMAKICKREALATDQAKTDFISSVSHELRSPLHGILGSLELLQERDSVDRALLGQIEKCSTTLLDIVEHLLDFAKLNHHASRLKSSGTMRHRKLPSLTRRDSHAFATLVQSTVNDRLESLSKLVEDVSDAAFYSHCCSMDEASDAKFVDFILDSSIDSEICIKDEVGAWKRLVMNLINNALKFTSSGHVAVSLKTLSRKRKRPIAVLSVSDTGCGMSEDFVKHRLFRAFSQENSLATGTGLGLSVVAKLVKELGGKIDVQSQKGSGSTFTVAIPLELGAMTEAPASPTALHQSARIGLLQPPESDEDEDEDENENGHDRMTSGRRRLHLAGIESSCRRIGAHLTCSKTANLNLVFAEDLPKFQKIGQDLGGHLIVLCHTLSSAMELQSAEPPLGNIGHVEYVAQPFGPDRLRNAITNCLQGASRRDSTANGDIAKSATSLLNKLPSHLRRLSDESRTSSGIRASSLRPTTSQSHSKTSTLHISNEGAMRLRETLLNVEPRVETGDIEHTAHDKIIPLPTPPESSGSPEPTTPAEATATLPRKLSLLLVDDNPVNLRLLTAFADKNRHPRLTATNGQEAVDAYKCAASAEPYTSSADGCTPLFTRPDVCFLDINMPVLDGFQTARQIRAFEKESRIPPTVLIALTCLGSVEARKEAEACGIDMFLTKPVRPRELGKIVDTVAAMIDKKRSQCGSGATGSDDCGILEVAEAQIDSRPSQLTA